MKLFLLFLSVFISLNVFAVPCDCEVRVYSPTTGSYQLPSTTLKLYELQDYSNYSKANQNECRELCLREFEKDLPSKKLNQELLSYSETLIQEGLLGHNCTGLTTLKYPVRVKAKLGLIGLGNVADMIQVISYEKPCF